VEEKESIEYQLEPNNNIFEFEEKNNEGENPETTKKDDVIPRKKRVPDRYPQEAPKRPRKQVTTDLQALGWINELGLKLSECTVCAKQINYYTQHHRVNKISELLDKLAEITRLKNKLHSHIKEKLA